MNTAQNMKVIGQITTGLFCGLVMAAGPVDAAPSPGSLERKIAHVNATFVRDSPSMWGPKADAVIAARLVKTQSAWQRFRDLRCHTLAEVRGADQCDLLEAIHCPYTGFRCYISCFTPNVFVWYRVQELAALQDKAVQRNATKHKAKKGHVQRFVLDYLRTAKEAVTSQQITRS